MRRVLWLDSLDFFCEFTAPCLQVEVLVLCIHVRFIVACFVDECPVCGEFCGLFVDLGLFAQCLQIFVFLAVMYNESDAVIRDGLFEELKVGL